MARKKSDIKTIPVYLRVPEILMNDFDRVAKASSFSRHEAIRQAIREFVEAYKPEKTRLVEELNELVQWSKTIEKMEKKVETEPKAPIPSPEASA